MHYRSGFRPFGREYKPFHTLVQVVGSEALHMYLLAPVWIFYLHRLSILVPKSVDLYLVGYSITCMGNSVTSTSTYLLVLYCVVNVSLLFYPNPSCLFLLV